MLLMSERKVKLCELAVEQNRLKLRDQEWSAVLTGGNCVNLRSEMTRYGNAICIYFRFRFECKHGSEVLHVSKSIFEDDWINMYANIRFTLRDSEVLGDNLHLIQDKKCLSYSDFVIDQLENI